MEFNWWYLILDEIILVIVLISGITFFASKSLIKVKNLIVSETKEAKEYLKVLLEEHREVAVEKVGDHVEGQLKGLKVELKDALADKIIAEVIDPGPAIIGIAKGVNAKTSF